MGGHVGAERLRVAGVAGQAGPCRSENHLRGCLVGHARSCALDGGCIGGWKGAQHDQIEIRRRQREMK